MTEAQGAAVLTLLITVIIHLIQPKRYARISLQPVCVSVRCAHCEAVLFALFTNEFLVNDTHCQLFKFADDIGLSLPFFQKSDSLAEAAYLAHTQTL